MVNRTEQTESVRAGWRHDLPASIVVFLVALPLCMGIAVASGAPPAAGLITGMIGGILVGSLAGSPLQVSGPAAGLVVIVAQIIQNHGLAGMAVMVLFAGGLQILAGVFKLGQVFRAVAPAVIQGMLAGIGVLIFASQFHMMVDDEPRGSGLTNLLTIPFAVWKGLVPNNDTVHHWAAIAGLSTIVSLVLWKALSPRRLKFLPAPLVGLMVGAGVAAAMNLPIQYVDLPKRLLDAVILPDWDTISQIFTRPYLLGAITIALVASAETLLCATAVDQMHTGKRTRYDRELIAQGVGNTCCGLVGGLPMTGVIVRSSANVDAGARTRLSAILHGVWLLIFVALLPETLEFIPRSALAAILVYIGYKLVNVNAIRNLWKMSKSEVAIYFITLITIVIFDLLTGVLTGVALSLVKLLYTFSHLVVDLEEEPGTNRTHLRLHGAATFVRLPRLASALERVPPNTELHVDFESLTFIDHACLDLLLTWEKQHEATGGKLVIDWDTLHAVFRQGLETGTLANANNGNRQRKARVDQPVPAT